MAFSRVDVLDAGKVAVLNGEIELMPELEERELELMPELEELELELTPELEEQEELGLETSDVRVTLGAGKEEGVNTELELKVELEDSKLEELEHRELEMNSRLWRLEPEEVVLVKFIGVGS